MSNIDKLIINLSPKINDPILAAKPWIRTAANAGEVIKVLRDALDRLSRLGNGELLGNSTGNCIAQQALAEAERISGLTELGKDSHDTSLNL